MKGNVSAPLIIIVVLILLSQSIFLFLDARKRNHNYWLWGIVGLIQFPMPLLFYFIFARKVFRATNLKNGN